MSPFGNVMQLEMGKEVNGQVLYSMAAYYVDGILFDTGPYSVTDEAAKIFPSLVVEKVINTHHHEDHIGNNYLLDKQGIPIFAHDKAVALIENPSLWTDRLLDYQKLVWDYPPASRCNALGEYLSSRHYLFKVIHTPGHSVDHICLLEEEQGWLFSGDLFLGEKVKQLRSDEDIHLSIKSLECLLQYQFDTIFCCSGRVFKDGWHKMQAKLDWWQDIRQQVIVLEEQGLKDEAIRDQLLGPENLLAQITEGDLSRLNLIRSFNNRNIMN